MNDPSTNFYDALAPMFDVMTDWTARLSTEGPFLKAVLEEAGARSVLDAACGSGGHALALAEWGYAAAGVDASPVMVDMARRKAADVGLDVPFAVADLGGLAALVQGRQDDDSALGVQRLAPYDAVLCLGNSLPHLLTQSDLVQALRGMAAMLVPGGLLVLQNLNYDMRWRKQPRWFAAQGGQLDGREVLVWRFADYDAVDRADCLPHRVVHQKRRGLASRRPYDAPPPPVSIRSLRCACRGRLRPSAGFGSHVLAGRTF